MEKTGSGMEQKKFLEVVGNLDLIRKKLQAGFGVAFLLCKNFKIYISPDNTHEKAAKMAGIPSNNSKDIIIKGRISPKISAFLFIEKGKSDEDFLRGDSDPKLLDSLVPEITTALKNCLGEGFENYSTHYKESRFSRSPESTA